MFGSELSHEYELAASAFDLTPVNLGKLALDSFKHTFANETTKAFLLDRAKSTLTHSMVLH